MNKKKIIFLVYSLAGGGIERIVVDLYYFLKNKINLKIVTFENKIDFNIENDAIINLNVKATDCIFIKPLIFILRVYKFKKLLKKYKPDAVLSFGESMNFVNLFSTKKSIISVHSVKSISNKNIGIIGKIHNFMIKKFYKMALNILTDSYTIKNDLIKNYNLPSHKIEVVYVPTNTKKIIKMSKQKIEFDYKKKNIITNVGRVCEVKRQDILIKAFKNCYNSKKDLLLIIGKGEMEEELKDLTKKLNIEKNVVFLGWQENPYKYIAKSKIFILTSYYEGFPVVLVEALSLGVPVISTNLGGVAYEILSKENEYQKIGDIELCKYGIITKSDIVSLSGAIRFLLDNYKIWKKLKNNIKSFRYKFDINIIGKRYLEIINEAIS